MTISATGTRPTIAVFASDKGPGDPERASIMAQVGSHFARRGARLVCVADHDAIAVPLITSARAAGGDVLVLASPGFVMASALSDVAIERITEPADLLGRIAELADGFIGLPGSLASASMLYSSWVRAGAGASGKPVVLYNRNQAFEVLRGYAADILSPGLRDHEKIIQFSDSVEDTWGRLSRMLGI